MVREAFSIYKSAYQRNRICRKLPTADVIDVAKFDSDDP